MKNNSPRAGARITRCLIACLTSVVATAAPVEITYAQQARGPVEFSIPAGDLAEALDRFAEQSDLQVVSDQPLLAGLKTAVLTGRYTPADALKVLLRGTNLDYAIVDGSTVVLRRAQPATGPALKETQRSDAADVKPRDSGRIEEIIVTAQKREERLIDVPQAVTVLSADDLGKIGALQFRDFANAVPGLIYVTSGAGRTQLAMRGVTVGVDLNPSVAIYVDDVPYGSSTFHSGGAQLALDVGLFDLDRVEVLRGPQGTLWGASTVGGLIKYVAKRPDASLFGADVQGGTSITREGAASYHGAATVNAPIAADKAALRATGFYSRDGGYFDNVQLGDSNVDRSDIFGGRVDLLLTPSDALTIRMTGFLQEIDRDGRAVADFVGGEPVDGFLDQRRLLAEPFDQRFWLVSGAVTYEMDWASLTSISGYQSVRTENFFDNSSWLVPLANGLLGRSYSAGGFLGVPATDKFTQEVRLASSGSQMIDWLVGGFYTHEESDESAEYVLLDQDGQPAPNDLLDGSAVARFEESAAFGNLTWHLTSKFNVSGGLRYARNRQSSTSEFSGLFGSPLATIRSNENVSTYLANARYHFNERATGYLRYATGYRAGGPNTTARDPVTGIPVIPPAYEADRLKSYEVGFKSETADRRFSLDVAGYYNDWSNIQILVLRSGFGGLDNAPGGASTRGVEVALTARPTSAFTATGAFAYQDAKLSEAEPELGGAEGERLPNVPRFTAALNADYALPLGQLQPTIGATLRYVDERRAGFSFGGTPSRLPEYTTVDLRTGIVLDRVTLQLYARNLLDERGQLSGTSEVAILQPRTVGINIRVTY